MLKEVSNLIMQYSRDSIELAKANMEWAKRLQKIADTYSKSENKSKIQPKK